MSRKTEEDYFIDFADGAVIGAIVPYFIVGFYQAIRLDVNPTNVGISYDIMFGLFTLFLFISFLLGLGGATLRGGIFGAIGYFIGSYGASFFFSNTVVSIAIMFFGAMFAGFGSTTRTRSEFKEDIRRLLEDFRR